MEQAEITSAFLPVENVLKVGDGDLLHGNNNVNEKQDATERFSTIGAQSDWKIEQTPAVQSCAIISENGKRESEVLAVNHNEPLIYERNFQGVPVVFKEWSSHNNPIIGSDQKIFFPASLAQQLTYDYQAFSSEEKCYAQFDSKIGDSIDGKIKRRDPIYRSREKIRQKLVMRIKRQDPGFREQERERGRCRMRIKRLDPSFRSRERERQRERMKRKRSDPKFREKEREQQKTRLSVRRLDPEFREKEKAQDRLRMRLKRQGLAFHSKEEAGSDIDVVTVVNSYPPFHSSFPGASVSSVSRNLPVFPENFNSRVIYHKADDSGLESVHFKKQQIHNFNFYNTAKEQWSSNENLHVLTSSYFNNVVESSVKSVENYSDTDENDTNFNTTDNENKLSSLENAEIIKEVIDQNVPNAQTEVVIEMS